MRITSTLLTTAVITTSLLAGSTSAGAASPPLSDSMITTHFDLATGQTPENLVARPNGSTDVTLVGSRQIANIGRDGQIRVLATMPLPADGGVNTPLAGTAAPTGITRASDGTIFVAYAAGDSSLTGLWSFKPGTPPRRISALPAASFPNGIALDESSDTVYIADSALGTVWQVPREGGAAQVWSTGPGLERSAFAGANGLKVHLGAVWVSNTDAGTLLRIPVGQDGSAGQAEQHAAGLTGIDDFAFTGRGEEILAALFMPNQVILVDRFGETTTVLDATDGLQNPTAVSVQRSTVVVSGSARATGVDPNLVTATLQKKSHR